MVCTWFYSDKAKSCESLINSLSCLAKPAPSHVHCVFQHKNGMPPGACRGESQNARLSPLNCIVHCLMFDRHVAKNASFGFLRQARSSC